MRGVLQRELRGEIEPALVGVAQDAALRSLHAEQVATDAAEGMGTGEQPEHGRDDIDMTGEDVGSVRPPCARRGELRVREDERDVNPFREAVYRQTVSVSNLPF